MKNTIVNACFHFDFFFKVTVADLDVYDNLDTILIFDPSAMPADKYPGLLKLREMIKSNQRLNDYLNNRKFMDH